MFNELRHAKLKRVDVLLHVFLGVMICISLIFLFLGLKRKSRLTIFFGVIAFIAPLLYFGFRNWIILLPLVPVVSFVVSDLLIKQRNSA
ncbi:hypothetical protein SporoP17a_15935 [Sporosarcina ureae]|nr:hypothetical protein SporoP17a_15935 [Sporosarcina ureae]